MLVKIVNLSVIRVTNFVGIEPISLHNKRDSKLFYAFLDASKAFDKVLINGLIYKLVRRNVPLHFIRLLFYWFNNLSCSVVDDVDE